VLNVERKKGRDEGFKGMTQGGREGMSAGGSTTATGKDHAVGYEGFVAQVNREFAVLKVQGFDARTRTDFDLRGCSRALQTFHDGRGVVGDREHPSIVFGFNGDIALCKPVEGVARLPSVKGTEELTSASRVLFD
jgi:hypothetical protein